MDTDSTRAVSGTVLPAGEALHDCSVGLAHARGQTQSAVGGGRPEHGTSLAAFVGAHERALRTFALAYGDLSSGALGRNVTRAAISTLEVEPANAASRDSRVVPLPPSAPAPQGGP
ncbi:MAG: hypothetical protein L0H78_04065 [Humibacillus sp.]|nr:hypothetical protein [Humibacillus sp.]